ncbi:MAG: acyl-CoA desaturase [Novosphingobium sp.]
MSSQGYFLADVWAKGHATAVPGMLQGGTLGVLRTSSNILQQAIIHVGTGWALWLAWSRGVTWVDLSAFVLFYVLTGLGASLGLHRLFSHQSFRPPSWFYFTLAVLASMCMQGSPARWATDHQRHHACSDKAGDPHSPLVDPFGQKMGFWRGFYHAHWGWMFNGVVTDKTVYGQTTWGNPILRFVSNTHYLWIALGLVLPWLWGRWLGGTTQAALTAMLWGGPVRACLMMHGVLSATSIAHLAGPQAFITRDQSRNNWLVVLLTFGDGWHNNHHKFPRSARHGLLPGQVDISGRIIELFEAVGLIGGVVRVPPKLVARALTESAEVRQLW